MNIDLSANPASTLSVRPGGGKFASKDFTGELYLGLPSTFYKWTPSWLQATKAPIPKANEPSCLLCLKDDIIFGILNSSDFAKLRLR